MGSRRVKFAHDRENDQLKAFESLPQEDRRAILRALKDFSDGKESGSPIKNHPHEIGLGAERNWAINLVEDPRDSGIWHVIGLDNKP
jgi:hypothetical protein